MTALDATLLAFALGGLAALLHHPRALTLLVAWGVGGIVLALLRPVRSHEPIESRADPSLVMLALFFIPLLTPPISAWGERTGLWILPGKALVGWIGVVLSAAGFAIRTAAMARLGSRFSPLVTIQKQHSLEMRGLYARIRHPGYLGAWVTTLGAALAFGSGVGLPLVAIMLVVLGARMDREEQLLERHFGDEYRRYRERTGRFLPRILRPNKH